MSEEPESRYAVTERRQSMKDDKVRLFSAGCLSSVIPGVGQFFRGLVTRGLWWASAFLLFLIATFFLKPWQGSDGMMAAILAGMVLLCAAGVDAAYIRTEEDLRPTMWSVALFVCIAFVASMWINMSVWRIAGFATFSIPSTAMEQTIAKGESIVANMHAYRDNVPHRGDIVIFENPEDRGHPFIKRVVAVPGDTIQGQMGKITLNGVAIVESYVQEGRGYVPVKDEKDNDPVKKTYFFGPVKLGPNEYFVMGDNRGVSYDSRHTGPVRLGSIEGKALFIMDKTNSLRDGRLLE